MARITFKNPVITAPDIIYTVRHGQSIGNARGMDDESLANLPNHQFPLTELGNAQIALSAKFIYDERIIKKDTGLYTSNFLRAQESMEGILRNYEGCFEVTVDPRLDEWWKGIFHSLSREEISKHYPIEEHISKREGWHQYKPLQGQAGKDVEINLIAFLNCIPEKEIVIAGHGKSFAFLRRLLTNQPTDINCKYEYPNNGEIWKFTRKEDKYYHFKSLFTPKLSETSE